MKRTIDELLDMPYWVVDILPKQVPQSSGGQFFRIEDYYLDQSRRGSLLEKRVNIVLKLNCYLNVSIEDEDMINPAPERIAEEIQKGYISIRVGDDSLITSGPDDTYMTVYNPNQDLLDLLKVLSSGEGLYVWEP